MTVTHDVKSTAGKPLRARWHAQLLVVGAGPAGTAAAMEAARRGIQVVLVDEHPVDHALMGLEVPFHFGQRMNGAVVNRQRMHERLIGADPSLAEAFDAGVDIRLGTAVWGIFSHRPGLRWVRGRVAGLTDGTESWFASFDAAIIATGRRDIGLAFPGWELPGVMGVTAAEALLRRYEAFDGQRLAILGSGAEATGFAHAALAAGRQIAALVEASDLPADAEGCRKLAQAGIPVLTGSMVSAALGGRDGVEGVRVRNLGMPGQERELACDTLVLAIGAAPVIDLLDIAGAEIAFASGRGGYVPTVDADGLTTVPMIFAAGDCLGIHAGKSRDAGIAMREGVRAAVAAAAALGARGDAPACEPECTPAEAAEDVAACRLAWARAAMAVLDETTPICQCEEVTLADLLGVRPPRYVRHDQPAAIARDIETLAAEGSINQDQVKRLTRAGMGTCQGRRCREQVAAMLADATDTPLDRIPLAGYRAPARPLPLGVLAEENESRLLTDNWEGWFGIRTQWVPSEEALSPRGEAEGAP